MGFIPEAIYNYVPFKDHPTSYSALENGESTHPTLPHPKSAKVSKSYTRVYSFFTGLLAAFLIFLLSISIVNIFTPTPKTAPEIEAEEWNYCGRSSKVAMERGCVMEPLFYGWMPPQCSWKEFSDRWPVFEDRTWYLDENMTVPIPIEDLWTGKHVHIYTSKYV
jgi:hypothetical protein